MNKYRTGGYGEYIVKVEVSRETKHNVWFPNGNMHGKWTDYLKYHDSWNAAHGYLLDVANNILTVAETSVEKAEESLYKIEALKEVK